MNNLIYLCILVFPGIDHVKNSEMICNLKLLTGNICLRVLVKNEFFLYILRVSYPCNGGKSDLASTDREN